MPKKPKSGGARLAEAGKRPMLLGWTPEDRAIIEQAARLDSRPMATFVQVHALAAAKKIIQKST